jgi:hypothetical protein
MGTYQVVQRLEGLPEERRQQTLTAVGTGRLTLVAGQLFEPFELPPAHKQQQQPPSAALDKVARKLHEFLQLALSDGE